VIAGPISPPQKNNTDSGGSRISRFFNVATVNGRKMEKRVDGVVFSTMYLYSTTQGQKCSGNEYLPYNFAGQKFRA